MKNAPSENPSSFNKNSDSKDLEKLELPFTSSITPGQPLDSMPFSQEQMRALKKLFTAQSTMLTETPIGQMAQMTSNSITMAKN